MPILINRDPFIIQPKEDFLAQNPAIKTMSDELAKVFASTDLMIKPEALKHIGSALWQALNLDEAFNTYQQQSGNCVSPIIIQSKQPAIQQLPWETLYHQEYGFLAQSKRFSLSRSIPDIASYSHPPSKGPLRILLFTAMTEDQQRLNVEEEMANVQEALMPFIATGSVVLEMPDDGRFSSFKKMLDDFQPQVLFMSGHGIFQQPLGNSNPTQAVFLFEAEQGLGSQAINQQEIAAALFGKPLECIVLSACQSGMGSSETLNAGLMTHLASQGIPHIIGMRESITDNAGITFAQNFCAAIGNGERVDIALQSARTAIQQASTEAIHPLATVQWCLPALISHSPERALIDWDFTPQAPTPITHNETLKSISIPARFIGRRLQLRELNAQLLSTDNYQQLLITGPGGQGKTALASKLIKNLQAQGKEVIAWSAEKNFSQTHHWDDFQFEIEMLLDDANTQRYNQKVIHFKDKNDKIKLLLRLLVKQFPQGLVILFDNLESVQDPKSRELIDEGGNSNSFKAWIQQIQALHPNKLTLILTSRWKIPNWQEDEHLSLVHLNFGDYLQLAQLSTLPQILAKFKTLQLRDIHKKLHGNARALEFFSAAIQDMSITQSSELLDALQQAKAEIQINMALEAIIKQRSPAQQILLNTLRVYQTPVAKEGIIKLALLEQAENPANQPSNSHEHDHNKTLSQLKELVNVSLVEKSHDFELDSPVYQCSSLVADWLENSNPPAPPLFSVKLLTAAADYQFYLLEKDQKRTLDQAIISHQAYLQANQQETADQLVLDWIIGPLNNAGKYQLLLEQWLAQPCQSANKKIKGDALGQTGKQYLHLGDYKTALKYLEQSLKIAEEIGDKSGEGRMLNNISQIYKAQSDYQSALKYLKQSLKIAQDTGNKSGKGTILNNISQIYDAQGDYKIALKYLKQSLKIAQEIGNKLDHGRILNNISQIYGAQGDYQTALKYLEQSLKIQQEIGDKSGKGTTLNNISQIYDAQGDYQTALKYLEQSLKIQQEIGDKSSEGTTLNNISQIYHAQGDYQTALKYLEQSLKIWQEIGDKSGEGTTLNNISQIYKAQGDYQTALKYLEQSLKIQQEIGDKSGEGTTLNNISQIYKAQGDYQTALKYLEQSLKIQQEIGDIAGSCATLFNMGHIYAENKKIEKAMQTWLEVYQMAKAINYVQALEALADLATDLGMPEGLEGWEALAQQIKK